MIWLIEASPASRSKEHSVLRRPFPWLTEFRTATEALRSMTKGERPSLIFLVGRNGEKIESTVAKLKAAVPGVRLVSLRNWTKGSSVGASLRRFVLQSSMPVKRAIDPPANLYKISQREREVLRCMVSGLIKKEIAEYLSLSYHTVDNHERHLFHKLRVHTRTAAVAKAVMEKLC